MLGYAILLLFALGLNWGAWRMMALVGVIGAAYFAPVDTAGLTQGQFYLICCLCEILVGLLAYRIAASASFAVIGICASMVVFHAIAWLVGGYAPSSPYRILLPICEYAQIVACIVLSKPMMRHHHDTSA